MRFQRTDIKKYLLISFIVITLLIAILLLGLYQANKFFDNNRLKFQNPIIIRTLIIIEPRNKPKQEKKPVKKVPAKKKTQRLIKEVYAAETTIAPFKKFLTDEANEVRNYLLPKIDSDYSTADDRLAMDNLLKKEAGYKPDEVNEIGACGMPQANPCSKMACGHTYSKEDINCQYEWMKTYIVNRYKTPTLAWQFHLSNNSY